MMNRLALNLLNSIKEGGKRTRTKNSNKKQIKRETRKKKFVVFVKFLTNRVINSIAASNFNLKRVQCAFECILIGNSVL